MDPLSALAAFNAGYQVIKTAKNNASELGRLFSSLGKMQEAKNAVDEAARKNPEKSDLELYAAKVELDQKWDEVRSMLMLSGHWDPYLKFVADRKRQREEDEKISKIAKAKKRKELEETLSLVAIILAGVSVIAFCIFLLIQWKPS